MTVKPRRSRARASSSLMLAAAGVLPGFAGWQPAADRVRGDRRVRCRGQACDTRVLEACRRHDKNQEVTKRH